MSCCVIGDVNDRIPVQQKLDGQVAVICKWGTDSEPIGRVVQRYRSVLVVLGEPSGWCYGAVLGNSLPQPDCLVRVLPPGTKIEVG